MTKKHPGRVDSITLLLGVALFAMIVLFSIWSYKAIDLAQRAARDDQVDRCVASLTADYFIAVDRALEAPPAPNPERALAGKDLRHTAERIRDRVAICQDGKPDDFQPAPSIPTGAPK